MKDNILQFVPKHQFDAESNLREFVEFCKTRLKTFGEIEWDSVYWDLTDSVTVKGRNAAYRIWWIRHGEEYRKPNPKVIEQPFLDFAKAYLRYQFALAPKNVWTAEIVALRALFEVLPNSRRCITALNPSYCNQAVQFIKKNYFGAAYRDAGKIETIVKFASQKGLLAVPFEWKNPLKRESDRNRIGKAADKERKEKMPTKEDIEMLGKAFNLATDSKDIIFSSIGVILMSNPSRISEILTLPYDCEVEKKTPDGNLAYGLRYSPAKGAESMIKWIPDTMIEATKLAISKIKAETDHARKVAKWYEENPRKLFLKREFEYFREEQWISNQEIMECFGFTKSQIIGPRFQDVRRKKINGQRGYIFFFPDIETEMIKDLPLHFPYDSRDKTQKYSEILFVVERHLCHSGNRLTQYWMVEDLSPTTCIDQFSVSMHGKSSLWKRLDLRKSDGEYPSITTHQFRHMLNTIAQLGGLSQLNIAIWSGRKEIHQNNAYDHVTADQMLALLKNADDGTIFGPENQIIVNNPSTKKNFLELRFPTAHTTEFGFCVHDFTMLPCQKHRDCINCREHVCIKGDARKTENVRFHFEVIEGELAKTKAAIEEGYAGANRWYEKHLATYERLKQLLSVLDDPTVPNGTVIHITPENEFIPILEASDERLLSE